MYFKNYIAILTLNFRRLALLVLGYTSTMFVGTVEPTCRLLARREGVGSGACGVQRDYLERCLRIGDKIDKDSNNSNIGIKGKGKDGNTENNIAAVDLLGLVVYAFCLSEEETFDMGDETRLATVLSAVLATCAVPLKSPWLAGLIRDNARRGAAFGVKGTFFSTLHDLSATRLNSGMASYNLICFVSSCRSTPFKNNSLRQLCHPRMCRLLYSLLAYRRCVKPGSAGPYARRGPGIIIPTTATVAESVLTDDWLPPLYSMHPFTLGALGCSTLHCPVIGSVP
jgi:hypothetical protein